MTAHNPLDRRSAQPLAETSRSNPDSRENLQRLCDLYNPRAAERGLVWVVKGTNMVLMTQQDLEAEERRKRDGVKWANA